MQSAYAICGQGFGSARFIFCICTDDVSRGTIAQMLANRPSG